MAKAHTNERMLRALECKFKEHDRIPTPPSHPTHSTHTTHMRMTTSRKLKSHPSQRRKTQFNRDENSAIVTCQKAFGDPKHRQNADPSTPKRAPKIKPHDSHKENEPKKIVRFMIQKTKRKNHLNSIGLCVLPTRTCTHLFPFSIVFFQMRHVLWWSSWGA